MSSADPGQFTPRRLTKPARRRHTVRNALWVVAALVVVVLVFVGIYIGSVATAFNDQRQTVDAGITPSEAVADGALNVLLLGSDSRGEGRDTAENKGEEGARSDTMMLVHIPEDRQDVYVMSIVRDLWVDIPGHGPRKVNAAMGLGGYPLVTATVEELLGVNVDHLAVIDFEGFNGLTQALGGVGLCNPHTFSAGQVNPSFFPQGEILLEGQDALRFVRERKVLPGGDFDRVANQQRFVSAMMDQVLSVGTLANPQRLMDVIDAIAPFITVDESLDAATIAGYALQLNGIRSDDIHTFTIPHGPPAEGPGGAAIVLQDPEGMDRLRHALQTDSMDEFLYGDSHEGGSEISSTDGASDGPDGGGESAATASGEASPTDGAAPSGQGEPGTGNQAPGQDGTATPDAEQTDGQGAATSATPGGTGSAGDSTGNSSGEPAGESSGEPVTPAAVCED